MTIPHFLDEAQGYQERLKARRRDLHQQPELGFQEFRTAEIVARELRELGLDVATGVGKTGLVGLLEGSRPGKTILLRFDMDALPVREETGAEYASITPGIMHACGHDGHVSIGLTVARLLADHRESLPGRVKFVFQPAEEGQGGAEAMIASGVLQNPRPDRALAMHLWNDRPVGWVGIVPGPVLAGGDTFTIQITGKGGHGALPQQAGDPVVAAAQIITALQTIASRNISPFESAVISVTQVRAGEAFNVIPPDAELTGTMRSFLPYVHETMVQRFEQIVRGIAGGMGCQAEIRIHEVTPPVNNDPAMASQIQAIVHREFPSLEVDPQFRSMVSEDMAFFLQEIPGVFALVGSANPKKGFTYGHHHPRFDFDEDALAIGAALLAQSAFELNAGEWDGN